VTGQRVKILNKQDCRNKNIQKILEHYHHQGLFSSLFVTFCREFREKQFQSEVSSQVQFQFQDKNIAAKIPDLEFLFQQFQQKHQITMLNILTFLV
jgi:hypothetical protein